VSWKLTFSKLTGPATSAEIHFGKKGKAGQIAVPPCAKGSAKPCKSGVKRGGAYVNVHTAKNSDGEIRRSRLPRNSSNPRTAEPVSKNQRRTTAANGELIHPVRGNGWATRAPNAKWSVRLGARLIDDTVALLEALSRSRSHVRDDHRDDADDNGSDDEQLQRRIEAASSPDPPRPQNTKGQARGGRLTAVPQVRLKDSVSNRQRFADSQPPFEEPCRGQLEARRLATMKWGSARGARGSRPGPAGGSTRPRRSSSVFAPRSAAGGTTPVARRSFSLQVDPCQIGTFWRRELL
jgi:CHRD domain